MIANGVAELSRLVIAAIAGSAASLIAFVIFILTTSLLHLGALPFGAARYSMFFVFFFAGLPILTVAVCGGIPLYLLLRNRVIGHAQDVFLLSGASAGALAAFIGWYLIWNTFSLMLGLAGVGVGIVGSYVFWRIAGE